MPIIRNGPFKVYVLYLDEKIELKEQFDLIEHTQSLTKKLNVKNEQFFSINILLEQNLDTIFSKFKKDTRNEIRRVENKELLDCLILQNMEEQELEYLFLSYSYFSKLKNIGNLNINRLKQLIALNKIFISSIYNNKNKIILYHIYYSTDTSLRLLHSFPSFFSLKTQFNSTNDYSRANKYLHWFDIQYFKTHSFINYDFGGWYSGSTDIKKLRINKFKEEFGGEIKEFFNYTQYCSHFSKLLSIYRQIKSKYQNRLL